MDAAMKTAAVTSKAAKSSDRGTERFIELETSFDKGTDHIGSGTIASDARY